MRLEEGSQPLATLCLHQLFCQTKVSLRRGQKSHNSWLNWNQLLLPYLLRTVLAIAIAIAIIDTFDIKWSRQKSWKMMWPKFTESYILPKHWLSLLMSFYSFVLKGWNCQMSVVTGHTSVESVFNVKSNISIGRTKQTNSQPCALHYNVCSCLLRFFSLLCHL